MADFQQPAPPSNPLDTPAVPAAEPNMGLDTHDLALMHTAPPPLGEPASGGGFLANAAAAVQALLKGNENAAQGAQNAGMTNGHCDRAGRRAAIPS